MTSHQCFDMIGYVLLKGIWIVNIHRPLRWIFTIQMPFTSTHCDPDYNGNTGILKGIFTSAGWGNCMNFAHNSGRLGWKSY